MPDIITGSLAVDGISLATVLRYVVRSRFNAISQEPFLLHGTARINMDLYGGNSDAKIVAALSRVRLWDTIEMRGGFDAKMREEMLSQG